MKKPIFDSIAADYDSWYITDLGRAVDQVENELLQSMFTPNGDKVLEIGCGTGLYTARLAAKGLKVTALDISGRMMVKAKERLKSLGLTAEWINADVTEVLDQLETYNGILSVTALEFIPNPEEVLKKLYAHLEPGGCLVIGIIAGDSPWSELYNSKAKENPESVFARARFYSEEEIRNWKLDGMFELGKCLFFPPSVNSFHEAIALEKEKNYNPGFLVAKWVKE